MRTDENVLHGDVMNSVDYKIKVKIFNLSSNPNPDYKRKGDSGLDIRSDEDAVLYPGDTRAIKTGLYVALPEGYELQVRSRSGLALDQDVVVLNSPGTIDSNYLGEIKIILHNFSSSASKPRFIIKKGDRIAQLVLQRVPQLVWESVEDMDSLGTTERNSAGFGSTGVL